MKDTPLTIFLLKYIAIIAFIVLVADFFLKPDKDITIVKTIDTIAVKSDSLIKVAEFWENKFDSISAIKPKTTIIYKDNDSVKIKSFEKEIADSNFNLTFDVAYFYEPIDSFNFKYDLKIKHKEIEKIKTITKIVKELETVTITEKIPFYRNTYFWISVFEFLLLVTTIINL